MLTSASRSSWDEVTGAGSHRRWALHASGASSCRPAGATTTTAALEEVCAWQWVKANELGLDARSARAVEPQWTEIRYEDLLDEPAGSRVRARVRKSRARRSTRRLRELCMQAWRERPTSLVAGVHRIATSGRSATRQRVERVSGAARGRCCSGWVTMRLMFLGRAAVRGDRAGLERERDATLARARGFGAGANVCQRTRSSWSTTAPRTAPRRWHARLRPACVTADQPGQQRRFGGEQRRRAQSAVAEWLCFLDADDWYYPERLAAYAALIRDVRQIWTS
jgi:hypothetical protein